MDFPNDGMSRPQKKSDVVRINYHNNSNDHQLSPKTSDDATGKNI